MDVGQHIELDAVKSAETLELLAFLDTQGIEIIAKLAGIVAGIPVIYVVGYDRDLSRAEFSMQISACGEAAQSRPRNRPRQSSARIRFRSRPQNTLCTERWIN